MNFDVVIVGVGPSGLCIAKALAESRLSIEAQLLVAADSRFSEKRRAMGISASMHDFGKTMLVCVMAHTIAHQHVAWEWFDYG
jgi:2-polyprenyl-6-methoxyphenol hydroxylase-like FAD-dependent oxidoreductase